LLSVQFPAFHLDEYNLSGELTFGILKKKKTVHTIVVVTIDRLPPPLQFFDTNPLNNIDSDLPRSLRVCFPHG